MNDALEKAWNQLKEFWQGTEKKKKIRLGISGLLVIIVTTTVIFVVTRTNYETLYTNLSLEDAGIVSRKLDEMGVEWKTGNSESTIMVSAELKSKIKYQLAAEGLPKDGYGFMDAFNDSSWMMTDYDKKERLKYALQNELARNISEISGIENADVYIHVIDDSGFVLSNNEQQAKASVFVKLIGSRSLTSDKVQAIQNLVAGAVKGMNPESVTVTDDFGKSYTNEANESMEEYNLSEQFYLKQNIESKINNSVKDFLENIFGYGNVDVRSSAKIDFDNEVATIREFSAPINGSEEGMIRSMETIEENTVNDANGGIPGVESNTSDTVDYAQIDGYESKYEKASKVINYELNEINKQIKKAPGQVESLTLAVLINEDAIIGSKLSDEKKKEIIQLIYAATGLDTKQVAVNTAKFNKTPSNEQYSDDSNSDGSTNIFDDIPLWSIFVMGLMLIGMGAGITTVRMNRNKNKNKKSLDDILEEAVTKGGTIQEIDIDGKDKSEIVEQINKFVDKKPDEVAQLLRTWLNEE